MHAYGDLVMYPLAHFFGAEAQVFYSIPIVAGVPCIIFLSYRWLRQRHQNDEKEVGKEPSNS